MKRLQALMILVGLAIIVALPCEAQARHRVFHPTLGRFVQRDPIGTPNESPATRNLSAAQFTRRDPVEQYADGANLYQYTRGRPVTGTDPQGEAVVFFGGGMEVPGTGGRITSMGIFTPVGFRVAAIQIGGFGPLGGMANEDAKVFGFGELSEARQWLKDLPAQKKCEVRIVGYSTGCSAALTLAQEIASSPSDFGVTSRSLKKLVFYDFNWGAASHPTYAPASFNKPGGNYQYHHVISGGNVTLDPTIPYTRIKLLPIPSTGGVPIATWTDRLWTEIPFRNPTWQEILKYHGNLGNTSGVWTASRTAGVGGGWLTPTATMSGVDHYELGLKTLVGPGDVMGRLFP